MYAQTYQMCLTNVIWLYNCIFVYGLYGFDFQMEPVVSTLSCGWDLWDGSQTIRHIGELQTGGWRQVAREFASDLLGIVSPGCIQEKNILPVGSPNHSGIADMDINIKHTLLIFTEMILNDFKRSFSISKSLGWCIPWWPTSKCDHAWSRWRDVAWSPPRFRRR